MTTILIIFFIIVIIISAPDLIRQGEQKFEDERLWQKIQSGEIDLDDYTEDEEERKPKNPNEVEEFDL